MIRRPPRSTLFPSRRSSNLTTEAAEGVSFDTMIKHQLEVNQILMADPNVAYVMSQVGFGRGTINQGGVTVRLKPRAERPQVEQVIQELRPKLAVVPGMNVVMRNDPPIRIGGIQSKALYQFTLQGADLKALYVSARDFQSKLKALPGMVDVTTDLQISNPQVNLGIDPDNAAALGVSASKIEAT